MLRTIHNFFDHDLSNVMVTIMTCGKCILLQSPLAVLLINYHDYKTVGENSYECTVSTKARLDLSLRMIIHFVTLTSH